jgi:predicted XRE-type DNA-binding protein
MIPTKHWTDQTLSDFSYWILSDFTSQIETKLEEDEISNSQFASMIHVTPSRVSQVLNDPGNLTVGNVVKYARGLQQKVALIVYDDSDPDNTKGPIHAEVFKQCWERMGRPQEVSDIQSMTQSQGCWVLTKTVDAVNDRNKIRDVKVVETAAANTYAAGAGAGAGVGGGNWRKGA